ncbi:MAG: primosomal protein N' [Chloroherpetonaceae bacterium]|nr:primosomal protein N' [Chloroherpetonaceae bacterium]MDW8437040.1 primosomal protein N' [Chloroherpetonaceae bacterium]
MNVKVACVFVEQSFSDSSYPYRVPEEFAEMIRVGSRVLVAFGRGANKKERLGFVSSISERDDEAVIGEIHDVFDDGEPALSPVLMRLAEWIADYYVAYPIEAIYAALPAAMRIRPKETVTLCEFALQSPDEKIVKTELRRNIVQVLSREKSLTVKQLERRVGSKHLRLALSELRRIGLIEVKKTYVQKAKAKLKTAFVLQREFSEQEKIELLASLKRSPKQRAILEKIFALDRSKFFPEELGVAAASLKPLVEKGVLTSEKAEVKTIFSDGFIDPPKRIDYAEEQKVAIAKIHRALEAQAFQTFLLHGVTGSGKTWIYIEAMRKTLEMGKTAIALVPEISLTPQTASRFRAHFGDKVRVLHSAMSDAEKLEAWQSLKRGAAQIALGPRSAVFAPLENVGLIVVDEEHESTYKQFDVAPRYHARDVAVMRAKFEGAVCLLGSATPSLESYHNATTGKYELLTLSKRADGATPPDIKLIWLPKENKISPSISETLFFEIQKRLDRNEQVILFQNRRGYAGSVQCGGCGAIYVCPACHVTMVFHLKENHLRCHYCGRTEDAPKRCKTCGSSELLYKSGGTEKVEQELQRLFPNEKILRMDLDTTGSKGAHAKLLREFQEGKARILLGTQMVAKGLDFPNVTLVGAILADIGLSLPDFRAGERLYSLLSQVAGRAGRSQKKGEVYLQVINLQSDVFRYVLRNDYAHFFEYEAKERQMAGYPPFVRLAKFEFSGKAELEVSQAARTFRDLLEGALDKEKFELLGPAPAVIAKIKHRFRYQLLVKQKGGARLLKQTVRAVQRQFRQRVSSSAVKVDIDIDAQTIM